jgi:hypothetical protein
MIQLHNHIPPHKPAALIAPAAAYCEICDLDVAVSDKLMHIYFTLAKASVLRKRFLLE